ncbi:MAG: enoyl-CoA hydratase/isomerase family protein [Steroidobacteraceae bacterium]
MQFEVDGPVATVTLNRPAKLNAITSAMTALLEEAVLRCNVSDDIRCVILTGAGERAFCVGSDIRALDEYDSAWRFRNRRDYCDVLRGLGKPSICAINGYAFGGGLEAALCCDILIAGAQAQFAAPEIKLGWIGGGGMAAQLSHSIGGSNAAFMIMTGDSIGAQQMLAWGLVSEVWPAAELQSRARTLAAIIASRAPIAAESARLNLRAARSMPLDQAMEYERDLQAICFATEDALEGRRAFAEKRTPRFRRR